MSTDAEVRKAGKQVTILTGKYIGENGRSMGPVGKHEVKVFVFSASREITFDVSDLDVA